MFGGLSFVLPCFRSWLDELFVNLEEGVVKSNLIKLNSENDVKLSNNQTICFCVEEVNIICLSGVIWITWAGGREKCLTQGDSLVIKNHFKICLQAFNTSRVRILRPPQKKLGMRRKVVELAAGFGGLGNRALSFLSLIAL